MLGDGATAVPNREARRRVERTTFLSERAAPSRHCTTAVIDWIDGLRVGPGERFELAPVGEFEERLAEIYPGNDPIRAMIRQQLQVPRDECYIQFPGTVRPGCCEWTTAIPAGVEAAATGPSNAPHNTRSRICNVAIAPAPTVIVSQ